MAPRFSEGLGITARKPPSFIRRRKNMQIVAVIVAGALVGAILGASVPTQIERKTRHPRTGWVPFGNGSILGILLNKIAGVLVLGLAIFCSAWLALNAGGAYPIPEPLRLHFAASLVVGAFVAKLLRHLYWKRRDPWVR